MRGQDIGALHRKKYPAGMGPKNREEEQIFFEAETAVQLEYVTEIARKTLRQVEAISAKLDELLAPVNVDHVKPGPSVPFDLVLPARRDWGCTKCGLHEGCAGQITSLANGQRLCRSCLTATPPKERSRGK